MGEVLTTMKIMPESPEVDLDAIKSTIESSMPEGAKIHDIAEEPIAFGFGFGWLFDAAMRPAMFGMILGQWLFKVIVALCDTPFFYLLTRGSTAQIAEDEE